MTQEQRARFWSVGRKIGAVLGLGAAYYLFVQLTGWGIPCVFYLLSGNYCPGCGVTRMCMALIRLDFSAAFRYNALLMVLLPLALPYSVYRWIAYAKTGSTGFTRAEQVGLILVLLLTVTFWILRNTQAFACLAPV